MQHPVQIEKLHRARKRILAFIDLDQRALERTPGIQALELSLTSWRRQLVSIDSKFTALTGLFTAIPSEKLISPSDCGALAL
ncbi:hypothetical protein [Pseudomonas kurunegalensis]|uniref:hypothetical protein n=1 Tax=Pseudomonas kurunegalensis TaxID=485880 RepID=UPI0032607244